MAKILDFSKFGCTSENVESLGTIMSCANLRRHVKTLLNVLLTVSIDARADAAQLDPERGKMWGPPL